MKIISLSAHTKGTDFIFPYFQFGDRMIFAKKPRKNSVPLGPVEKFNLSPRRH